MFINFILSDFSINLCLVGLAGERTHAQVGVVVTEQPDSWTAHRTETGIVYYYNTLTGESTYDKPPDFRGEVTMAGCS